MVVLVDGATQYRAVSRGALATHFTVLIYDRRGRSESGDTPPYAVMREVEDVAALIAAVGGKANLVGFSSGAVLAVEAAAALAAVVDRPLPIATVRYSSLP